MSLHDLGGARAEPALEAGEDLRGLDHMAVAGVVPHRPASSSVTGPYSAPPRPGAPVSMALRGGPGRRPSAVDSDVSPVRARGAGTPAARRRPRQGPRLRRR